MYVEVDGPEAEFLSALSDNLKSNSIGMKLMNITRETYLPSC
jgi:hypothetical protein